MQREKATWHALEAQLQHGCEALSIQPTEEQYSQLMLYLQELQKWNKVFNLTAIRESEEMVNLHLLDSLAVVPFVKGTSLLDIGTGAGLPGLIIAIMCPHIEVTLLDSNGKKTRFLKQVCQLLALDNVTVCQIRIESLPTTQRYDVITSRAFTALPRFFNLAHPYLATTGMLLAMVGKSPEHSELDVLDCSSQVHTLRVPGVDAERHLVEISAN